MKKPEFTFLKRVLPRNPGVSGRDKYFNSAVLVPLLIIDEEYHFLFQKRAANISQGGEVCFPGGKHDPSKDANCEETAIREASEELGIRKEKIKIIGNLGTIVAPMGAAVDAILGTIDISGLHELMLNKNEVEKVFTVPLSFFIDNEPEEYKIRLEFQPSYVDENGKEVVLFPAHQLGLPEKYTKPWGARKRHRIYVYKTNGEIIWGLTAELIHDLVKKLTAMEDMYE